ncbi:DUF1566 domain-containing protein [Thiomicrospira sp. ALE5]|uniref:Lcl domain-containing protein n=1 Tax=Thiomicrospira sp. ALE5 TaxID=748650 RepID=UPI0008EA8F4A|nr:DUF1566 domain-containing protein [Thiomicrospira sp. ALE5]SFR54017.1 PEGA domain-containing protein [Thiomicrospira sp. ALE5]
MTANNLVGQVAALSGARAGWAESRVSVLALALGALMLVGCDQGQVDTANKVGQGFIVSQTKLERPSADAAMVRITTKPGGAQIYINGHRRGDTPEQAGQTFAIKLAEGSYHIQVVKAIDANNEWRGERKDVFIADFTSPTVHIDMSRELTPAGVVAQRKAEEERKAENQRRWAQQGYVDNQDGTITDTKTNLTWMRCSLGQTWTGTTCSGDASIHRWQAARDLAKESRFADKSDWRLPTVDELHSLVYCSSGQQRQRRLDASGSNARQGNTSLDGSCEGNYSRPTIFTPAFPNMPSAFYWSASPVAFNSSDAWGVHFYNGFGNYVYRSSSTHVRLVRGGQ